MLTPWGELEVSDAHVHFFSRNFFAILAAQRGSVQEGVEGGASLEEAGSLLGWEIPPPEPERLAERWVTELDRHGVSRAALIASLPGEEGSVEAAVAHQPDRFWGYFMVNPLTPETPDRVQRALARGRLRGICLFPAMHRYPIQDERALAVISKAAARPGTVVFVHCGVLMVGVRRKLGLPSPFDMRFSNPIDLHAVALRFPEVAFVVPHFGAGYFREALMLCDLCPNVYLDTSSSNQWMRYQPEGDLKSVFRRALDVAGPGRLLFGTDSSFFPRGWQASIFRTQVGVLEELGVDAEQARSILGGNLARLLGSP